MAHLRKPGYRDQAGFDSGRNLQILPVGKKTSFYLVAGDGLDVFTDDPACAEVAAGASDSKDAHKDGTLSGWEKSQVIRIVKLSAKAPGTTSLRAQLDGRDWIDPLTVRVTQDSDARQVGKSKAEVTPELRAEIQGLPLREAVARVFDDQMNSAIGKTSRGFGAYMDKSLDWCGGFAYWCWDQACAIKGVENPFGTKQTVLWSPQRAIHWAIQDTTPGQLLRYSGVSPMDGKGKQEFRDIGWLGHNLELADIVLLREGGASGWKHVCMVREVNGTKVTTMDGNQGLPSIKTVSRSLDRRLPDKSYHLVFINVTRVPA